VHDTPGAIESFYATAALSGLPLTVEAYMKAVETVTTEQIARVAQTLQLHTVYFLRGE
jgi:predicted Zn-dependent peptidase